MLLKLGSNTGTSFEREFKGSAHRDFTDPFLPPDIEWSKIQKRPSS